MAKAKAKALSHVTERKREFFFLCFPLRQRAEVERSDVQSHARRSGEIGVLLKCERLQVVNILLDFYKCRGLSSAPPAARQEHAQYMIRYRFKTSQCES